MSLLRTLTASGRLVGASINPTRATIIAAGYGLPVVSSDCCSTFRDRRLITLVRRTFGNGSQAAPEPVCNRPRAKSVTSDSVPFRRSPASASSALISEACFDAERSRVVLNVLENPSSSAATRFEFPAVWLRDNCQCSGCFHRGSSSRVLDWQAFDVDRVRVAEVRSVDGGRALGVVWQEGNTTGADQVHRSTYTVQWLLERSFREEDSRTYLQEWYRPEPVLWGAGKFPEVLQEFSYEEVLRDDGTLRQWIEALIRSGVVMIKGAPLTEQECRKLADRVGFIRKTHYGEEFIVKAKEGTSNVAYLSTPLQMHTDLPYYDYKPGCNLLHCLVQSTNVVGGENLIADGFYVADRLRHEHPDDFRLLAETLVNWSDLGEDEGGSFHSIYRAPVICIGRDGRLERINHSVPQRDSHFSVPLDRVERWYRAMQRFVAVLHREAIKFRTAPGDILTFSNVRMVHGRTGYTDTNGNTRHIVGAYLDWDEIYSKLRVLKAAARSKDN